MRLHHFARYLSWRLPSGGFSCRVGRILVRKLLLRGYPVTALVRSDSPRLNSIPKAVRLVKGDIGEYQDLRKAMENIDKVLSPASDIATVHVTWRARIPELIWGTSPGFLALQNMLSCLHELKICYLCL